MLLELFENGKDVFKRGKTKEWLRERVSLQDTSTLSR